MRFNILTKRNELYWYLVKNGSREFSISSFWYIKCNQVDSDQNRSLHYLKY